MISLHQTPRGHAPDTTEPGHRSETQVVTLLRQLHVDRERGDATITGPIITVSLVGICIALIVLIIQAVDGPAGFLYALLAVGAFIAVLAIPPVLLERRRERLNERDRRI